MDKLTLDGEKSETMTTSKEETENHLEDGHADLKKKKISENHLSGTTNHTNKLQYTKLERYTVGGKESYDQLLAQVEYHKKLSGNVQTNYRDYGC